MRFPRSCGILLHPSSLPGRFGIGDLGPEAHGFVNFLAETGQRWWQVLPLGPTGAMNSPYQSHSSFAGNPLLISPEGLVERGWLSALEIPDLSGLPADEVDFEEVSRLKENLLRRAFEKFPRDDAGFQEFLTASASWLEDYSLYMAIKQEAGGLPWFEWEPDLVARNATALARWRDKLATSVRFHQFVQYVFDIQLKALRKLCAEKSVGLIGDIPIFVAHDSADVWARPDLFFLDEAGRPTNVAGVPPDYFSETGQLWGNPLYRWDAHQAEGFAWWINRLSVLLGQVDMIRIDHFRGFEAYWEVPGTAETAVNGRWVQGPGAAFFRALQQRYVDLPLIAEDLGVITPAVEALRDEFHLPGMRILQFAFSTGPEGEKHLPHKFVPHCIVYTGTHDNDTSLGWFKSSQVHTTQTAAEIEGERAYALRYLGTRGDEIHWDMIRAALASVADISIIPMQDILGLDSAARMNIPGEAEGNWRWRFRADQLTAEVKERLADLTAVYGRWNGPPPAKLDPHHLTAAAGGTVPSDNSKAEAALGAPETAASRREDGSARGNIAKPRKKRQGEVKTAGGKKNPAS